jgi:hypothetical protein
MATEDRAEPEIVSYTLRFPSELDVDQVTAWLHSLSGLLPGPIGRLWGAPSVVLELRASAEHGFQYRLRVPRSHAEYVVGQLRAQLPGVRVTPEKDIAKDTSKNTAMLYKNAFEGVFNESANMRISAPASSWTKVIELGMRKLDRSLRIESVPLVGSVLASMQGFALHRGEVVLVQWIVRPAVPETPPAQQAARPVRAGLLSVSPHVPVRDAVADKRAKLSSVNFLAVLRVGVKAGSQAQAEQLLGHVRAALRSTSTTANGLYIRTALQSRLRNAIDTARVPFTFPMQLTAAELTGLLAWPIGSPNVAGLPQARSRHLPPSGAIARTGLVVCRSNFPGAERPLALSPVDTCKHIHIVGPIGVGKTALMGNLVSQAMRVGNSVIVMESKGDLFKAALDAVPKDRLNDVIVLDVGDERPVGFNLLAEGNPRSAVEELCQLFEYLYPDMRRGIWARAALHRGLMTLITRRGSSVIDLVPLLSPNARSETESQWRDELIAGVSDPELKRFWERFDGLSPAQQENYAAPILDRVWQLSERREIRDVIGQSESSFTMREVIARRRILLVNLSGVGGETARLTGTLLLNAIWSAVRSGAADPARPTMLALDEFEDYMNLPVDAERMLVQARSFGLSMVLAHQHLDQLPERIRSATLANVATKIIFRSGYDDARVLAREFGRSVSDEDFQNLGQFEVLCRLATEEGVSALVSGETLPPIEATGLTDEVRATSRRRYGRDAAAIQADISQRRMPREAPQPKKRPRLGGVKWE